MTPASPSLPSVSIIIPVRNSARTLKRILTRLVEQHYPADRVEIIVVDNGSTDDTPEIAAAFPVRLETEASAESPYVARNLGITKASGEIIVLIDAACEPTTSDWLAEGVRMLIDLPADIVAGRSIFTFSPERTLAEQLDSISNQNMRGSVERRGVAKGSNLFIRRTAFSVVGMFPVQRSGGDVLWTGRATAAGLKLAYSHEAAVYYPARKLRALLNKQVRVGRGQGPILLEKGSTRLGLTIRTLAGFRPPTFGDLRSRIDELGTPDMKSRLLGLWWLAWMTRAATMLGRLQYLVRPTD